MIASIMRVARSVATGLLRSTTFALCALIVPACIALLPVLAALRLLGSPWSWSNPWSWAALAIITAAVTLALAHPVATLFRRLVRRWTGIELPDGYRQRPEPVRLATGYWWNGSSYERTRDDAHSDQRMRRVAEPAFRREVLWMPVAAVTVLPVCVAPAAALAGATVLCLNPSPLAVVAALLLVVVACAVAGVAWRIVPPLGRRLLTGTPASDTERGLREQRADLTAAHDAEIRRIERDLHDGAQSRLVAVGLDIAAAERLIESRPDQARELLRSARLGTADSLNQLRDLVRGVYPPVLVERGLVPALRAFALDSPLPVDVAGPDDLGLASPLAAALYFGVAELLTNAAKHARASRASVTVARQREHVDVVVHDDGRGGASFSDGGGLDGVRRRLAVFDAAMELDSPSGGPTTVTMRMPCE